MGIIRTIVYGFENPVNAYFVAIQAIIVLTLTWFTFVLAGIIFIWGIPEQLEFMFQFPTQRGAWMWFAGGGVLLGSYGVFLVYLLRKGANQA